MKKLTYALIVTVLLAVGIVIWWPGCGIVDVWVVWTSACEAAGGGGSGAQ